MPKNTIIPAAGGPGPVPPVAEQSIRFDQGRATNLRGYSPLNVSSDSWTLSFWFKRTGALGTVQTLFESRIDVNNKMRVFFDASDRLNYETTVGGVIVSESRSSRFTRDVTNWYHCNLRFAAGSEIRWDMNGYFLNASQQLVLATAGDGVGFSWLAAGVELFIGSNALGAEAFSGQMAEVHCVDSSQGLKSATSFGVFNARGVWERIVYVGAHGPEGFYLTFGRTVDLGEDFSGNNNDFTVHTNGAGGGGDQFDDWMEKNYCTLDVNDERSTGTIDDGALEVAAGNAAVTMRPDFGEWYYEVNGVATVWDTGVSGQFDPIFAGPSSLNFGQFPFVDVGPTGAEMTVNSNNFPATDTDIARDYIWSIEYFGDASDPRVVILGEGQSTSFDTEYADILERVDLAWVKNAGPGEHWYQAHRLRPGLQVAVSNVNAEESVNVNGTISDLPDPGPGVEMTKGSTDGVNVNEFGNVFSIFALHVRNYAQNLVLIDDADDAEEETSGPGIGNVDVGSSDIEMVKEGGTGPTQEVGLRWNNLLIPQASTILAARIQFEADDTNTGTNDMFIFCEDIDDAPIFVDGLANFNITGRTKTTGKQAWSPADWTVIGARTSIQRTPDILPPVQEVIDRGGWAPGNSLAVIVGPDGAGSQVEEREAEAATFGGNPAELQVAWRSPGVEAESGVSLFTYEGIGIARDVMHGNPNVPDLIALKNLGGNSWVVYNSAIVDAGAPEDGRLGFNNTAAYVASADWDNTAPGSTFFRVGTTARINEDGIEFAGFTIANLPGFAKVFRYVGNGSAAGPLVYLGFKPRFMVIKRTQAAGNWVVMHKSASIVAAQNNQYNVMENMGFLNTTDNFLQTLELDAYSHGFKVRNTDADLNAVGAEYVGFAFAEQNFQLAKAAP